MMGAPILSLNTSLTINYSAAKGRYLTTTKDIAPNTLIFSEPLYAAVSNYSDYCSGCLTRQQQAFTARPYYCHTCSRGRETEVTMFQHPDLKGLKSFGILCFRIVNRVIREKGFDLKHFSNMIKGEGNVAEYKDDYLAVAGLKTSNLLVEDKAINLVLKALEIFNNNHITDHNLTPDQLLPLVQHVFSTLQYNVQGVRIVSMASLEDAVCTRRFIEEKVGAGLYPTLALLNHSCNANTRISFEGGNIVLYSTLCIAVGCQVTHNYGPTVEQMEREQRRVSLEQVYGFVCDCVSCRGEGAEGPHAMACGKCAGPISYAFPTCTACGNRTNPEIIIRNEQELIDQLTMIEFDWCEDSVKALISHAEQILFQESTFLGKVYDKMAKRYCEDSAWSKAEEFTAKSCDIIKAVYGHNSVTYAIELFKLCQAHYNLLKAGDGAISVFKERVKECCVLFSEPSGVREEVMRELDRMLEWIKNERCFSLEVNV